MPSSEITTILAEVTKPQTNATARARRRNRYHTRTKEQEIAAGRRWRDENREAFIRSRRDAYAADPEYFRRMSREHYHRRLNGIGAKNLGTVDSE